MEGSNPKLLLNRAAAPMRFHAPSIWRNAIEFSPTPLLSFGATQRLVKLVALLAISSDSSGPECSFEHAGGIARLWGYS
jgi:hypothetical protein